MCSDADYCIDYVTFDRLRHHWQRTPQWGQLMQRCGRNTQHTTEKLCSAWGSKLLCDLMWISACVICAFMPGFQPVWSVVQNITTIGGPVSRDQNSVALTGVDSAAEGEHEALESEPRGCCGFWYAPDLMRKMQQLDPDLHVRALRTRWSTILDGYSHALLLWVVIHSRCSTLVW